MEKRAETAPRGAHVRPAPDKQRRVVVRYADGTMLRGYFDPEDAQSLQNDSPDVFRVKREDGETEDIFVRTIKAIFFVKSFEGSRHYSEFKVFTNQPNGRGVWVRVHFQDGEIMEGIAPNSLDTYMQTVFSLTPPDPRSNNERVLVSKACLKEMQILGLAAD